VLIEITATAWASDPYVCPKTLVRRSRPTEETSYSRCSTRTIHRALSDAAPRAVRTFLSTRFARGAERIARKVG
jgi:hypothetical protein